MESFCDAMQLPLDAGDKKCLCPATPAQTCSTWLCFVIVICDLFCDCDLLFFVSKQLICLMMIRQV